VRGVSLSKEMTPTHPLLVSIALGICGGCTSAGAVPRTSEIAADSGVEREDAARLDAASDGPGLDAEMDGSGERDGGYADDRELRAPDGGAPSGCWIAQPERTRIACVGDSITFGYGIEPPDTTYPAQLRELLGAAYDVGNFGQNGASALHNTGTPYTSQAVYVQSNSFAPHVVVLQLGTNDSASSNWSDSTSFESDYRALVEHYRSLGAFVLTSRPPPVYGTTWFDIDGMLARLDRLLVELGTPVIDVHAALSGHPEWFPDGVHPTGEGVRVMTETIEQALLATRCAP
jgi:acyl-CoA thioesterase I